jgi:hypothetical protein
LKLASLTHQTLYGERGNAVAVVRDEYLAPVILEKDGKQIPHMSDIDYYGVTFDHLVPADCSDPEVLVINIIEVDTGKGDYENGADFANDVLLFSVNPEDYTGKKVLAVPRCCQHKRGRQDRGRINNEVAERAMASDGAMAGDGTMASINDISWVIV